MTITDDVEAEQAAWRLCLRRDAVKETTDLFALGFHAGLAHERARPSERMRALETAAFEFERMVHAFDVGDDRRESCRELHRQMRAALEHPAPIEPEPERKGDEVDAAVRAAAIRDYKCYYCSIRRRFSAEDENTFANMRIRSLQKRVADLEERIRKVEALYEEWSYKGVVPAGKLRAALTAPASDETGE